MPFPSQRLGCPLCTLDAGLQQGNKAHPFPDTLLSKIRERLSQECQNGKDHMEIAEGPPFFLNLISSLAQRLGDPDWEYPLTLREGVPLRVSSPTLQSPPRKNSEGKKTRSQTTHPSKKGTIIHQPKNSLMRLMPLLKMKRKWEWSWDPSPNKRQLRPANALQTNSVRDQWQGSKNPTRSGQFFDGSLGWC
jgi:hypothetical protein